MHLEIIWLFYLIFNSFKLINTKKNKQLAQEKELRIKFENDYNDLKIELRFVKEKQIDLEEELNETLKAKKMAVEENLSLIYVNKVMEEKLIAATELIDQLKQNENER